MIQMEFLQLAPMFSKSALLHKLRSFEASHLLIQALQRLKRPSNFTRASLTNVLTFFLHVPGG